MFHLSFTLRNDEFRNRTGKRILCASVFVGGLLEECLIYYLFIEIRRIWSILIFAEEYMGRILIDLGHPLKKTGGILIVFHKKPK